MALEIIVTGLQRSGTVYMAKLLTSLGLVCGHESIFTPDGLSGVYARLRGKRKIETSIISYEKKLDDDWFDASLQVADSSYLAAPYLSFFDAKIIHIVRNPLYVISSIFYDAAFWSDPRQEPYREYVFKHLQHLQKVKCDMERLMIYYVEWNELIECNYKNLPYLRYTVEQEPDDNLFNFLGFTPKENIFNDKKSNSWQMRSHNFTYKDLPRGKARNQFLDIIEKYGYLEACGKRPLITM
jgi:hypothetical protein